MTPKRWVFICLAYGICFSQEVEPGSNSDMGLNVVQLIRRHKYTVETHTDVKTKDGYLLTLHRIPVGRKNITRERNRVAFLMHGIMCSSVDWINMGPEKSIGYLLADIGYDVWMGNARGTLWSRKHISYDPDRNHEFWNFSWHEIGIFDLPAMIDYILNKTGADKLFYIGHSQGTTTSYVLLSERPEYNRKLRLVMSFAPIAYMSHMYNPLLKMLAKLTPLSWMAQFVGFDELTPDKTIPHIDERACEDKVIFQEVCSNLLFLIGGYDSEQLNRTTLPLIFANAPAGCSMKQVVHYGQEIKSGRFCQFDYGKKMNVKTHGTETPPRYKLENILAPVSLLYSENDHLAALVDVLRLANEMPNVVDKYKVPLKSFNHLDFLWANDVVSLLYNHVFKLMEKY